MNVYARNFEASSPVSVLPCTVKTTLDGTR